MGEPDPWLYVIFSIFCISLYITQTVSGGDGVGTLFIYLILLSLAAILFCAMSKCLFNRNSSSDIVSLAFISVTSTILALYLVYRDRNDNL